MRDYDTMRNVLFIASKAKSALHFGDFQDAGTDDSIEAELGRLTRDGLINGDVLFTTRFGERSRCKAEGLTDEGLEFFKLIENDGVWDIIRHTLQKADIDVSYPLLKEVCEEIVKRYVTSFIPEL